MTSRSSVSTVPSTHSGSSGALRTARMILSGAVGCGRSSELKSSSWSFSPGPGADDLDRDVRPRARSRQPDHVAGQVDDPHRLAHLEHEHLARAAAEVARPDHQLDRLRNGHEVAGHLGVR